MPRRRKLLITQTAPQNIVKSPYTRLADKYKLQIDFRSFISLKEFVFSSNIQDFFAEDSMFVFDALFLLFMFGVLLTLLVHE